MREQGFVDVERAVAEIRFLEDAVAEVKAQLDDPTIDLSGRDDSYDINRPAVGYMTQQARQAGYLLPGEQGAQIPGLNLNPDNYYYRRERDRYELAKKPSAGDVPQVEVARDAAGGFLGVRVKREDAAETRLLDMPENEAIQQLFDDRGSMTNYAEMVRHLGISDVGGVVDVARHQYKRLAGVHASLANEATLATLRQSVKQHFRRAIEQDLFDPSRSDAASYQYMRAAVDLLSNSDRAQFVERWYRARNLQGMPVSDQVPYQVTRTSGKMQGQVEARRADFLVQRANVSAKRSSRSRISSERSTRSSSLPISML